MTMLKEWESYRAECFAPDADEDTLRIAKMTFYAGGVALAALLTGATKPIAQLDALSKEMGEFLAEYQEATGYAQKPN
jgi:hypothetical protein